MCSLFLSFLESLFVVFHVYRFQDWIFIPILLTDGYGLVTCKPADLQQEAVNQDTIR